MNHIALAPETNINSAKKAKMINVKRRTNIVGKIAVIMPDK
jgi:hypothetical protein